MSSLDSLDLSTLDTLGISNSLYSDSGTSPENLSQSMESITDLTNEFGSKCSLRSSPPELIQLAERTDQEKQVLQSVSNTLQRRRNIAALLDPQRKSPQESFEEDLSFNALVDSNVISREKAAKRAELLSIHDRMEAADRVGRAAAPIVFACKANARRLPIFTYDYSRAIASGQNPAIVKGKHLGSGGVSVVHQAQVLGSTFAMKTIPALSGDYSKEFALIQEFDHPNVISCHLALDEQMLIEFAPHGDLAHLQKDPTLTCRKLRHLLHGAAEGLSHIHERGYVHRDVKPGNILIGENGAIVADLELAVDVRKYKPDSKGTIHFIPKDALEGSLDKSRPECIKSIDSFAFGIMIYEFLKQEDYVTPYLTEARPKGDHEAGMPMMFAIWKAPKPLNAGVIDPQLDPAKLARLDPDGSLRALMLDCLKPIAQDRPQMAEIAARLQLTS